MGGVFYFRSLNRLAGNFVRRQMRQEETFAEFFTREVRLAPFLTMGITPSNKRET